MAEEPKKKSHHEEKRCPKRFLCWTISSPPPSLKPADEGYALTKKGLQAFIAQIVEPGRKVDKVSNALIDDMIAEIDNKMSLQLDAILHNEDFQKMESAWRSLKYLVDHTDFRENIKLELLNVSKEDLLDDFEDAPEITKSGLYRTVYTAEFGQFGGQPYGNMVANYEFGPGPRTSSCCRISPAWPPCPTPRLSPLPVRNFSGSTTSTNCPS